MPSAETGPKRTLPDSAFVAIGKPTPPCYGLAPSLGCVCDLQETLWLLTWYCTSTTSDSHQTVSNERAKALPPACIEGLWHSRHAVTQCYDHAAAHIQARSQWRLSVQHTVLSCLCLPYQIDAWSFWGGWLEAPCDWVKNNSQHPGTKSSVHLYIFTPVSNLQWQSKMMSECTFSYHIIT